MPRTLRRPAPRSSSPTLASLFPSMNLRKFSAGSQRRRRGRTALARSWLSALDNQLTEGRAILILCIASELQPPETERPLPASTELVNNADNNGSRFMGHDDPPM